VRIHARPKESDAGADNVDSSRISSVACNIRCDTHDFRIEGTVDNGEAGPAAFERRPPRDRNRTRALGRAWSRARPVSLAGDPSASSQQPTPKATAKTQTTARPS